MSDELDSSTAGDGLQGSVNEYIQNMCPPSVESLELDFVYQALAHPRRRYLCYSLLNSSCWRLRELATKLVAWEQNITEAEVTEVDCDEMYISLYHAHVPKLVELGVIEYEDEIIRADTNAPQVLAALEGVGESIDSLQETHARRDYQEE